MSHARDAYHHGDLRNALVASAVRLIEQGGEAAFSLREAARDVGVSANAAYRHFDDKTALLTAAAAGGLERLSALMQAAMDRAGKSGGRESLAIARFRAVGRAYVEFALAHPELFRLMFSGSGVECLARGAAGLATALESALEFAVRGLGVSDALLAPSWMDPGLLASRATSIATTERRLAHSLRAPCVPPAARSLPMTRSSGAS